MSKNVSASLRLSARERDASLKHLGGEWSFSRPTSLWVRHMSGGDKAGEKRGKKREKGGKMASMRSRKNKKGEGKGVKKQQRVRADKGLEAREERHNKTAAGQSLARERSPCVIALCSRQKRERGHGKNGRSRGAWMIGFEETTNIFQTVCSSLFERCARTFARTRAKGEKRTFRRSRLVGSPLAKKKKRHHSTTRSAPRPLRRALTRYADASACNARRFSF